MQDEFSGRGTVAFSAGARRCAQALFLIYCSIVACATLLPFQFTLDRVQNRLQSNSSFFQLEATVLLSDLVGNIILFVPIGVLAVLMQRRGKRTALWRIAGAGCCGLLLSLAIELVQWFTPSRAPAISDISSNTLGALLGAGLMELSTASLANSRWGRTLGEEIRRDSLVLAFMGALWLTAAWAVVPFDASLHPHTLARSLRGLRLHTSGETVALLDLTSCLLFALSAGAGVRWAHRRRPARRVWNACMILGGVGIWATGLEIMQLALTSRTPTLLDVFTAMASGCIGIFVSLAIERVQNVETRRAWATLSYVAGLLLLALRPLGTGFGVEVMRRRIGLFLPGYGANFEATLAGVTEQVHAVLLFVPLGYLAAPTRRVLGSHWAIRWFPSLLVCALVAVLMNIWMAMATRAESPAHAGILAACLGGLLGASARAAQRQLAGGQRQLEHGLQQLERGLEPLERARGKSGPFQTGTGFARKDDADTATSRPPLA